MIRLLSLCALVLIFTACDMGRVIDTNERNKVLYNDENGSTEFGTGLAVYENSTIPVTAQSEYNYWLTHSTRNEGTAYYQLQISSLLVIDQKKAPLVSIGATSSELVCIDQNVPCNLWSHTFNLQNIIYNAPKIAFEVLLAPVAKYALYLRSDDNELIKVAAYETYILSFKWPGYDAHSMINKQHFLNSANLANAKWAFLDTDQFKYLYRANFLFPGPTYEYAFSSLEARAQIPNQIDFEMTYLNLLTGVPKTFKYAIERLP